jgi:curli biogenesis system outer membrane secretion channel CsgG
MKRFFSIFSALVAAFSTLTLVAQEKTIGVSPVVVSSAIQSSAASQRSEISLKRVAESMDGQFISALQSTRKFQVIARSDLPSLQEEGGFTGSGLAGVSGVDYLLVVSIDDFQDIQERVNFSGLGKVAERRTIRLGAVAKIYDSKSGKLLESSNLQIKNFDTEQVLSNSSNSGGSVSDALIRQLATELAQQAVIRVTEVVYPAKILAKTGKIVTINRGDGTGIAAGQLWEVFALGEELKDPDTGASLGKEEMSVGKVRILRVTPKTAQGEVSGEDLGIDRGAIVRRIDS